MSAGEDVERVAEKALRDAAKLLRCILLAVERGDDGPGEIGVAGADQVRLRGCIAGLLAKHEATEAVDMVGAGKRRPKARQHRRGLRRRERPGPPKVAHDRLGLGAPAGIAKGGGEREPAGDGYRLNLIVESDHRIAAWPECMESLLGTKLKPLGLGPAGVRCEDFDDFRC